MSGLHNIYLRAKGMLSTIIAKDTFITPRKLIIKRKRVNATQADGAGVSETVRRMLRKIRRKVILLSMTTVNTSNEKVLQSVQIFQNEK
jgi:hypothetical protein